MPTPAPGGGTQRGQTEGPSPSLGATPAPVTAGHCRACAPALLGLCSLGATPGGVASLMPSRWAVPHSPCHRWGPAGLLLSPSAPPSDAVCLPVPAGCSHPWVDLTSSPITCPGVVFFFSFPSELCELLPAPGSLGTLEHPNGSWLGPGAGDGLGQSWQPLGGVGARIWDLLLGWEYHPPRPEL